MDLFTEKYCNLLLKFANGKKIVLSSSKDDIVTSRMMSVVCINGLFYFQTDKTSRKYYQLINNSHVALCSDNIQIEGICKEIGHPTDNPLFCEMFEKCFKSSFNAYTSLKNERLFVIEPTYVESWVYIEGEAYIENYDVEKQEYKISQYVGL